MTASAQHHLLFGLKVRSALPLPELAARNWEGPPDVSVWIGPIDHPTNDDGLSQVDDGTLLTITGTGRYLVRGGREIVVEPTPDVDPRNVRLYLLGSAFGILLHQRGLLPLHANAVDLGGRAFGFMGPSGSGKSTLAAWFHDHHHGVLADDVCVVDFDTDGRAFVHAGIPRLRLWLDALNRTRRNTDGLHRSYVSSEEEYDKFDVPIMAAEGGTTVPLAALYLLERGERFSIAPLMGISAAEAVIANIYRGSFLSLVDGRHDYWNSSVELARRIPIFRVTRSWDERFIEDQCRRLADHASRVAPLDHDASA